MGFLGDVAGEPTQAMPVIDPERSSRGEVVGQQGKQDRADEGGFGWRLTVRREGQVRVHAKTSSEGRA
jgi:hypothetical protein